VGERAKSSLTDDLNAAAKAARGGRDPDDLLPAVYDELRRIAGAYMKGERPGHTLDATGLVHEAYLKLVDQDRVEWQGRTHFLAVAARAMRRILVDHARTRARGKRGGSDNPITLRDTIHGVRDDDRALDLDTIIDLDAALQRLETLDERQAELVELRFFGGCTVDEAADRLGISTRTAEGDWMHARAWLRRELADARDA
jgi:RNA polymerase sigma factor (TIGR02999 family)